VVDHIYQNSVSKNAGESQSVMQLAANMSSPAWLSFSSSIRSCMENPVGGLLYGRFCGRWVDGDRGDRVGGVQAVGGSAII